MEEAIGAESLPHRVGETGQFNPVSAHDANAAKLEALGKIKDGFASHQRGEGVVRREIGRVRFQRDGGPCRRDHSADNALPSVGLQPIDPRRLIGQALPDR